NWLEARVDNNKVMVGITHVPVLAWSLSNQLCCDCDNHVMVVVTPITYRGLEEFEYGSLQLPDGTIDLALEGIDITSEADLLAYWKKTCEVSVAPHTMPCSDVVN